MDVHRSLSQLRAALQEGARLRGLLYETQGPAIVATAARIHACLGAGGKLLLCGNGGSAADCQHIAAELVGRYGARRRPGLAALALTTDTSALTAIANDFGYEEVFARQVEALGRPGDVLLCLSTSGRSPSVLRAAQAAAARGLWRAALTGPSAGPLGPLVDQVIAAPGASTARVQELHITVGHLLCELVEEALEAREAPPA